MGPPEYTAADWSPPGRFNAYLALVLMVFFSAMVWGAYQVGRYDGRGEMFREWEAFMSDPNRPLEIPPP